MGIPANYNGKMFSLSFNVLDTATAGETTIAFTPVLNGVSDSNDTLFTPNYQSSTLTIIELLIAKPDAVSVDEDSDFTVLDVLTDDSIAESVTNPNAVTSKQISGLGASAGSWTVPTDTNTIATQKGGEVKYVAGILSYQPKVDFFGTDSFYYQVQIDTVGHGNTNDFVTSSAMVTVTVNALNDAPVLATVADLSVDEDAIITAITLNATDVEGNAITYGASSNNLDLVTTELVGNQLTLTLQPDANGEATITITASDAELTDSKTFVLTVNSINDAAPVFEPIVDVEIAEDADSTVVTLVSSDVDNEEVTYTAGSSDPGLVTVTVDGDQLTITPNPNGNGEATITIVATDESGAETSTTFTVTVTSVNDAPVSVGDAYTVEKNSPLTVDAVTGLLNNDSDEDGDELLAFIVASPSHGKIELAVDGSFVYNPSLDYLGSDSFSYWVYDGALFSEVVTVTLEIKQTQKTALEVLLEGLNVTDVRIENLDRYQAEFDKYNDLLDENIHFYQQIVTAVNANLLISEYSIAAGWNMISSPYVGWSPIEISGSVRHRPTFAFDNALQIYNPQDSRVALTAGVGYWVHIEQDEVDAAGELHYLVMGTKVPNTRGGGLEVGWNLVGPIVENEAWIVKNRVYTWLAKEGYYVGNHDLILTLGKGYWVFVWDWATLNPTP